MPFPDRRKPCGRFCRIGRVLRHHRVVLSYRHAFHAGNHGDVLKHVVLVALLAHFRRKETPFLVVDTHAGAGMYALGERWSAGRAEIAEGVARLWGRSDAPEAVQAVADEVVGTVTEDGLLTVLNRLIDPDRLALLRLLNSARVATWCWAAADNPMMRPHAEHHLAIVRAATT